MEIGQQFLQQKEYERAVRYLRKSFILHPLPEAAALMQRAQQELRSDPMYCQDCSRFRANCSCGSGGRAPGHQPDGAGTAHFAQHVQQRFQSVWQAWLSITSPFFKRIGLVEARIPIFAAMLGGLLGLGMLRMLTGIPLATLLSYGDLHYSSPGGGFHFYSPVASSIMLSVIASLAMRAWQGR